MTSSPLPQLNDSPLAHERAGLDACVHCGFCLPACPTYTVLEDENDSPRGRIVLMRALLEGEVTPHDADVQRHIGQCLGCRGCETACPSGVPYGHLLEATRATLRPYEETSFLTRLVLAVMARPWLTRIAMGVTRVLAATPLPTLASRLPSRYGFTMAMLAATEPPLERGSYDPEPMGIRESTALLTGCVMEGIFTRTNRATERVLRHNGYQLVDARGQGCCGALHAHAGDLDTARALARANIAAFEASGAERIAVNSAGCGAMMKEYGQLLRDDPVWRERAEEIAEKVRDATELLAEAGPIVGGPLPFRVTYDAPCHLCHAQSVRSAPLEVLEAIPELVVVPLRDSEQCCGGAGVYNLVHPDVSTDVLNAKLSNIHATGASLVVTGNPGCLMQIGAGLARAGLPVHAVHPIDLLDASYASL